MATLRNPTVRSRVWTYVGFSLVLLLVYLLALKSAWRGSSPLHTLLEEASALLALVIGGIALIRYYSRKNNTFLFIGSGFLGTALLDGYHAVITSSFYQEAFRSPLQVLAPWSGMASRLLLAVALWLSLLSWKAEQRHGHAGKIGELEIYGVVGGLTIMVFALTVYTELPVAIYPNWFFARPQELLPALFFLLTLAGYLQKGGWRQGAFEHWLVLSLVASCVAQALFMATSDELYDSQYILGHLTRVLSYLLVLIGLLINMFRLFRRAEESAEEIREANVALTQEMAERRKTEADLEASRQLFTKFMDNSPAIATMKDQEGRLLYVNATFERVFQTTLAQICGKLDSELWPAEVAGNIREMDIAILKGERAVEVIETLPTPKAGLRQWLAFKFPFRDANNQLRLGTMAVDITERQRAQEELRSLNETLEKRVAEGTALAEQRARELERSNVELEQFAYIASHDLQEPLRSVASFAQLLARRYTGKLGTEADEFISYIVGGATRMSTMIKDLLAYSRAGRADKPLKPTACNAVLQEALTNLKVVVEETGAQITHSPLPTIMADVSQLTRLFQNLLSNAIKFRGEPPPRVHVNARRQEGGWCFSVEDNGIGIAPEQFHRLFLIFQRLNDPAKYSGSGIGLAVCKKIVERHGGRIWVESTPGAGTTFFFSIPDMAAVNPA